MTSSPIFTLSVLAVILAANFVYMFRVMKWYPIRKAFPLNEADSKYENILLNYGKANICGHYARNKVISGIMKAGVVIKKPFPFSYLMPPIFIPWGEIEHVSIVTNLEGKSDSKTTKLFSSSEYAKIELKRHKEYLIIIPWQGMYFDNLPKGMHPRA
ncbi:MAG: hypothetical protein P1P89_09715 [Desulfobacterales bacterium]|nr:hypothetical protein [Desulfobacterales bacterium]